MMAPVVAMVAPKQGRRSVPNLVSTIGPPLGAHDRPRYGGEMPIRALCGRPPLGGGGRGRADYWEMVPKFAGFVQILKMS